MYDMKACLNAEVRMSLYISTKWIWMSGFTVVSLFQRKEPPIYVEWAWNLFWPWWWRKSQYSCRKSKNITPGFQCYWSLSSCLSI